MSINELLKVFGSVTRARLFAMMMKRPRLLSELSEEVGVTPQAVLKHLKLLQKRGFISSLAPEEGFKGLVKKVYKLVAPVRIYLDEEKGGESVHIYRVEGLPEELAIESIEGVLDTLQGIEEEKHRLERKLNAIRRRGRRIVEELVRMEKLEDMLMKRAGYGPFKELLTVSHFMPEGEEELASVARHLKVEVDVVRRVVEEQ